MKLSPQTKRKIVKQKISMMYSHHHDDDDFDRGEEFLILGLGFGIWGIYWAVIHFLDKFTFNFIMRPRNLKEVEQVLGIIKMFRLHSRPSWAEGMLGHGFMKYPMEFHVSFLTLESGSARVATPNKIATNVDKVYTVNEHLPKIKPCVCTNVETNYTPQSIWTAYKGGNPVAVNLGLSFSETELVMADDVERGW